jgi:hypothetical protein
LRRGGYVWTNLSDYGKIPKLIRPCFGNILEPPCIERLEINGIFGEIIAYTSVKEIRNE